jgi:hypothetical protein
MSRSYTSSPPHVPPWHVAGQFYFFTYYKYFLPKSEVRNVCYICILPCFWIKHIFSFLSFLHLSVLLYSILHISLLKHPAV